MTVPKKATKKISISTLVLGHNTTANRCFHKIPEENYIIDCQ